MGLLIILYCLAMIGFACIICVAGLPLAAVAETFEYDVLRYLNNPLTLRAARRQIGDQLLPHLTSLDWGFRFAGKVINSKQIGSVFVGLAATLIGSVGQAVFDSSAGAPVE